LDFVLALKRYHYRIITELLRKIYLAVGIVSEHVYNVYLLSVSDVNYNLITTTPEVGL